VIRVFRAVGGRSRGPTGELEWNGTDVG
jgi:hypothetical protein